MVRRTEGAPDEGGNVGNIKIEQERDKRMERKIQVKAGQRNRGSRAQKMRHSTLGHYVKTEEGTL